MKIAHIILAHAQPEQLQRLANKLLHPDADSYIHIDAKQHIEAFNALRHIPHVHFVQKRVKVTWGSYSMVQATLNAFEQIIASGIQYDYINLLSGQDYPLNEASFIHQYFALHHGKQFMEFYSIYDAWHEAIPRVTKYHLINYDIRGKYKLEQVVNKLMPVRRMPRGLEPVGRSQWFTITLPAARYILHYLHDHPEVTRFFKLTWAPDEFIFQTILFNSDFRGDMVNDNLRYMDWSEAKPSPKTLTSADIPALEQSGCLFARKVNIQTDKNLLDAIDTFSHYKTMA
ncbi:glycosyl transferase [Ilyomonas limi]|uniref:Peptide O-xylosyltransferase n=1 Tax=Ilyomonas limi TaxID=2575867 RepID=A0A4U3KTD9_9BACT|nr:beta-1,6-N-acetylglucosaminyltransferase [Ilyomonas limi]TKK65678.1 glycosyl transferase [Ilyomonas limi]